MSDSASCLSNYEELKTYLKLNKKNSLDWCLAHSKIFNDMTAFEFVNEQVLYGVDRNDAWKEILNIAKRMYG